MEDERAPSLLEAIKDFSEHSSPVDFVIIAQHWDMFLTGIGYTLLIVAVSLIVGGALSLPLAVARAYRTPILNPIIFGYVYVFRGTPLLVQLYLVYYGLGQFEAVRDSILWPVLKDPLWCTLITFVLNTAAYTTEIFRGAIEAIDPFEAHFFSFFPSFKRQCRNRSPKTSHRLSPSVSTVMIL